jgi:NAD(P)-dependent dehydrogenase (short-subunit alcohol dehydrogenase family)
VTGALRVLVTGAGQRSIGLATAEALAGLGHEVVVTTRSAPVPGFDHHPLDLADRRSVVEFASWFGATYDGLDVLVNNAGVHLDLRGRWSAPELVDGQEVHWRTNYLGTVHLTRALLPQVLDARGRVVHVVSKLHARGRNEAFFSAFGDAVPYDSWTAYGTSKLALVHDAAALAERHRAQGLRAYAVHPGVVATGISGRGLETSPVLGRLHAGLAPLERALLSSPAKGARTTVHCATDPDAASGYYLRSAPADAAPQAGDTAARAALWARTEQWLKGAPA